MNVNMSKSFLKYFVDVNGIFEEYYLTHGIEYCVTWKNILPRVHGLTIFMDENVDDK
jgi:hypothetical protein